jgi:hypothetical protein
MTFSFTIRDRFVIRADLFEHDLAGKRVSTLQDNACSLGMILPKKRDRFFVFMCAL